MTCRIENGVTYTHTYNAENRASSIAKRTGDCATGTILESWSFLYDGDGIRVETVHFTGASGTPDSTTSYYMGGQYEIKDGATKKYYSIAGMMVAVNDGSAVQYLLTDHLGSTVAVTNASGTLTSQQRYLPFGGTRAIPNSPILGTDFTYTGQRLLDSGMGGIMDYKARFYSVGLGRFVQPDTIIPDQSNPQSWNRYSYVVNRPISFNDPTGHMMDEGDDGGFPCYPGELACQLWKSGYKPKTKEQVAKDLRLERPVSGFHIGLSNENGVFINKGGYVQLDFLMDWKNGNIYTVLTVGGYTFAGTPTGKEVAGYAGLTTIHGIPLYRQDDISPFLAGDNIDIAASVGADAGVKVSGTKGLSVDLDDSGKPVHTGAGLIGYQYAVEDSLEIGGNVIPNEIDFGGEFGISNSTVTNKIELPWWPFR